MDQVSALGGRGLNILLNECEPVARTCLWGDRQDGFKSRCRVRFCYRTCLGVVVLLKVRPRACDV